MTYRGQSSLGYVHKTNGDIAKKTMSKQWENKGMSSVYGIYKHVCVCVCGFFTAEQVLCPISPFQQLKKTVLMKITILWFYESPLAKNPGLKFIGTNEWAYA